MTLTRRSMLMSGAAALLTAYSPAVSAQNEQATGMILRRVPRPGEDPDFFLFGQPGDHVPTGEPVIIDYSGIRVVVHYPLYTRNARLVVFSHGALADPQVYRRIIDHWVSHGFMVAAPIHDDSVFERGLLARRTAVSGEAVWEVDKVLNDSAAWDARCEACRLPLDAPERLGNTVDMRIDTERPIIIGHEFGAYVAQLLLGANVTVSNGKRQSFYDSRWYAGCLLSPQGAGIMGLDDNSWEAISKPMMIVQGELETDFTGQEPIRKIDPFQKSVAGNKHLMWFPKGDRLLYSGPRAGVNEEGAMRFENLKAVTTAFIDAYANYDADTFKLLVGGWAQISTRDDVLSRYR